MYDSFGKAAARFALTYLRRRYSRQIRFGLGLGFAAVAIGIAAYFASRNVPEG